MSEAIDDSTPVTATATFCTTLVDEWARSGLSQAFVAPGSRSTPLALALASDKRFAINLFHDERAASFAALGSGLATGKPAILLCTSGTAAAHFHASVIEADLSAVPLIVCSADRPPELWDRGAPQTVDQTNLYGRSVRYFAEPGVPDETLSSTWRSLGARLVVEAQGWSGSPGPVHANLSFRDPLVGRPAPLPPGRPKSAPWHSVHPSTTAAPADTNLDDLVDLLTIDGRARPGAFVVGRMGRTDNPDIVNQLARQLGWPVLADQRSGARSGQNAVRYFDSLLRVDDFAAAVKPEVVIKVGEILSSKVVGQWQAASGADVVAVAPDRRWIDPDHNTALAIDSLDTLAQLVEPLASVEPAITASQWLNADRQAHSAVAAVLNQPPTLSEPNVAAIVTETLPAGGALVVSSSMPVRDVEWFGPNRADINVFANRGANGIDGVVSTAIGVATTGVPTTVLIGDVALLHDSTSLIGLAARTVDLHIVVVDNDGGGIFSFLPQAQILDTSTYEQLFGTPHSTDLVSLFAAHHVRCQSFDGEQGSPDDLRAHLSKGVGSPSARATIITSNRTQNAKIHQQLNTAIAKSVLD